MAGLTTGGSEYVELNNADSPRSEFAPAAFVLGREGPRDRSGTVNLNA